MNKKYRKLGEIGEEWESWEIFEEEGGDAEVDACKQAGFHAYGATLYLIGHIYCCDNCIKVMKEYGIKKVVIGKLPPSWNLKAPTHLITPKKKHLPSFWIKKK